MDFPRVHGLEDALALPGGSLSALYGSVSRVRTLAPQTRFHQTRKPAAHAVLARTGAASP